MIDLTAEDVEVEELAGGRFVWVLTTSEGASYRGAQQRKTRRAALADGRQWLQEVQAFFRGG